MIFEIYSDGSTRNNGRADAVGAWAYVVLNEGKKIYEELTGRGLKIQAVLLTHGHFDHIGAVKALKDAYQIPVYCSKEEDEQILRKLGGNLSSMFGNPMTLQADEFVRDGEKLEMIGTTLTCLATPGHTIGGMCYYVEELASVIAGDTLFAGSVGRTDFPTGSFSQLIRSIKEKLFVLPDDVQCTMMSGAVLTTMPA